MRLVHTTDRTAYKSCRQRWDFSSNLRRNLQPIVTRPNPLWFGTGIHLGLATYYDPVSPTRSVEAAVAAWEKYCAEAPFDVDEHLALGVGMLQGYVNFAAPKDNFHVAHVEQEVHMPIAGISDALYSYRLDGLVQDKRDDSFYIIEFKTAAKFEDDYEYLLNDDQVSSYILLEQRRLGVQIKGVLYNILKKKLPASLAVLKDGSLSVDKRQDTTFDIASKQIREVYGGGIPDSYREFVSYLQDKPNNFFKRFLVTRNQREVARSEEALVWEVSEMLGDPHIYRSPSAWNCKTCAFFTPCLQKWEGGDFETTLRMNYEARK